LRDSFCEDDLYATLAWLSERQVRLEKALFRRHADTQAVELFLYDVTSNYLEGEHKVLGAYGYCRDKKRGKPQIVVGLLTDAQGEPVSVEVFRGNTSDVSTLTAQVRKLAQAFGCQRVTLVGDRGLIKQVGIEALHAKDFYFISAITKAQIETLLKQERIEMGLFDQPLGEVKLAAEANSASAEPRSLRYILKRNPVRAQERAHNCQLKKAALENTTTTRNWHAAPVPNWPWRGGNCSATLPSSSLRVG
jgi:DDE family transposase